jgi:hypothetical protein
MCLEDIMHNLISYNQLAGWTQFEKTVDECNEQNDKINDYFDCLIECDENHGVCQRICVNLLK